MTYEDWLLAQGYTQDENGKWRLPEGGILSDDQFEYMRNADYAQWQEANASGAYGTEGVAPGDDLKFFSTADRSVTINGENYIRVGEDSTNSAAVPYFQSLLQEHPEYKQFLYNDQYGWVVPEAVWSKLGELAQANNQSGGIGGFFDSGGGVFLLAAAFGAMAAGATAAAAAETAATSFGEGLASELGTAGALGGSEAADLAALSSLEGATTALPAAIEPVAADTFINTITPALEDITAPLVETAPTDYFSQLYQELVAPETLTTPLAETVPNTVTQDYFNQLYQDLSGGVQPNVTQDYFSKIYTDLANTSGGLTINPLQAGISAATTAAGALAGGGGDELTPEQQWAQEHGLLNPDGSINYEKWDSTDPFGMGSTDGAGIDDGSGASASLATILQAINTATGVGGMVNGSDQQYQNQDNESASRDPENILNGTVPDPTGLLSKILNGTATAADWSKLLGTVAPSVLGALGAKQQADAYKDVANQYLSLGAPYRDRLNASYQPGFSLMSDPAFKDALDVSSQGILRNLSAKVGNPYDNPGAVNQAQNYIMGNVALPQLNAYRSQLGSFGQLGLNTAGSSSLQQPNASGGVLNSIGYGLGQLLNPPSDLEAMLKKFGSLSNTSGFKLNTGYGF
jgi:hypothetical protein